MKRGKPLSRKAPLRAKRGLSTRSTLHPRCQCGDSWSQHHGPDHSGACKNCVPPTCPKYRPKSGLSSKKPMKARKADPSKRRFAKKRQPEYTAWVSRLSCMVGDGYCWHPADLVEKGITCDPAHVDKTRATGAPDYGEVANLCRWHHINQEGRTAWFNERFKVDVLHHARVTLPLLYERHLGKPVL